MVSIALNKINSQTCDVLKGDKQLSNQKTKDSTRNKAFKSSTRHPISVQ